MITDRVKKLRQESLVTKPYISTERGELVTKVYSRNMGFVSEPVLRALVFKHLMEDKTFALAMEN